MNITDEQIQRAVKLRNRGFAWPIITKKLFNVTPDQLDEETVKRIEQAQKQFGAIIK